MFTFYKCLNQDLSDYLFANHNLYSDYEKDKNNTLYAPFHTLKPLFDKEKTGNDPYNLCRDG